MRDQPNFTEFVQSPELRGIAESRLKNQRVLTLRRTLTVAVILLVGTCVMLAQTKPAVPSKDEAKTLLNGDAEITNLRAAGSPPFHLRARAKSFGPKGDAVEGTYEGWWASADQWREEIRWGNSAIVAVAGKDHMWKQGENTHLLETTTLSRILNFWSSLKVPSSVKVKRVQSKEFDGASATCIQVPLGAPDGPGPLAVPGPFILSRPPSIPDERTICLDSGSALPVRVDYGPSRLELGTYVLLGMKRFPRTLRMVQSGKPLIEVQLESLDTFDSLQPDVLAAPTGARSKPWCSNMIPPKPVQVGGAPAPDRVSLPNGGYMISLPPGLTRFAIIMYHVDEKGHVLDVHAFNWGGEASLKESEKHDLLKSTFQPATCQGKPLEADFSMEFHPTRF